MQDQKPHWIQRITIKQWSAVTLTVIALVFILQNLYRARVQLLFFHTSAPLWAVMLGTLMVGYLIGRFSTRR